jgi:hypothetical protein
MKRTLEEIEFQKKMIRRTALDRIAKIVELTPAVRNCIEKSEGFPIYLADLQDAVRALGYLAAQHTALDNLKCDFIRERSARLHKAAKDRQNQKSREESKGTES